MSRVASLLARPGVAALALCLSGAALAQSAPSAYTSATRYDIAGRAVGTIAPDPDGTGPLNFAASRNTYDAAGYLIRVETGELAAWQADTVLPVNWPVAPANPSGFTVLKTLEITNDAYGRKLIERVKGSDGVTVSLTQYSYDALGRLDCTAARMNPAAYAAPPASACTLGTAGTQGPDRIVRNLYDDAGQLVQVRKAVGITTANGFPATLEQAYTTYTYTPNGKQQLVIDANGNKAQLVYDGFDRQTQWIFPSASALSASAIASFNAATPDNAVTLAGAVNTGDYEQYGYDANGNRTSLRKRDGSTLTYTFDSLNRMTVKTVPARANLPATHSRSTFYGYDARGLMTSARFDSATGEGLTTAYDGFGRISASTIAMDAQSRTLSYQYDQNGNRTRVTFPDSTANYAAYTFDGLNRPLTAGASQPGWTKTYAYNARGELVSDVLSGSAGTTTWNRDPVGRLSSLARDVAGTTSDITSTFAYNTASQIVSVGRDNDAYVYTGRANGALAYTANGLNQYASVNANAYCYDGNGNLTADGVSVYLYDVENRLVEKHAAAGGTCTALSYAGALQASLRYDPMGRLYETSIGTAATTTRFLIDGDALVGEYDAVGNILRRYVHGADGKADDPVAWYEGPAMSASALRFLHANQQGSIKLTGDSAGNASRIFAYDEYGVARAGDQAALSPANGARFLYTGQALVPELGMYYYKARIYAPQLGRFMQTDPIGYEDQNNLYGYAGNDPVNGLDPMGLYDCARDAAAQCDAIDNGIREARMAASNIHDLSERGDVLSSVDNFGKRGDGNGVIVNKDSSGSVGGMQVTPLVSIMTGRVDGAVVTVNAGTTAKSYSGLGTSLGAAVAHEGSHITDMYNHNGMVRGLQDRYNTEYFAASVGGFVEKGLGHSSYLWSPTWGRGTTNEDMKMKEAARDYGMDVVCKNGANCNANLRIQWPSRR